MANIYFVGNVGVGKSFLGNCLLQQWKFESKNQAAPCTKEVEIATATIGRTYWNIYNIPGLLEADASRIEANVSVFRQAFQQPIPAIIFYVLTTEGGRVRDSDYIAYKAIKRAYRIDPQSFCFVVNKSKLWDNQEEIRRYIHQVLDSRKVIFIPDLLLLNDTIAKRDLHLHVARVAPLFHAAVKELKGSQPAKTEELKLEATRVLVLKAEAHKQQVAYEEKIRQQQVALAAQREAEARAQAEAARRQQEAQEEAQHVAQKKLEEEQRQKLQAEAAAAQARAAAAAQAAAAQQAALAAQQAQQRAAEAQAAAAAAAAAAQRNRGHQIRVLGIKIRW